MHPWQPLADIIRQHTQQHITINTCTPVGGGCINQAYKISTVQGGDVVDYFIKLNNTNLEAMFTAEARALSELSTQTGLRVPRPICTGTTYFDGLGDRAYLVLEHLELCGRFDDQQFGQQLALMHRHTSKQYGWQHDNTIGSTPQYNKAHANWCQFWRDQRLGPQLDVLNNAVTVLTLRQLNVFCLILNRCFINTHPKPPCSTAIFGTTMLPH